MLLPLFGDPSAAVQFCPQLLSVSVVGCVRRLYLCLCCEFTGILLKEWKHKLGAHLNCMLINETLH